MHLASISASTGGLADSQIARRIAAGDRDVPQQLMRRHRSRPTGIEATMNCGCLESIT